MNARVCRWIRHTSTLEHPRSYKQVVESGIKSLVLDAFGKKKTSTRYAHTTSGFVCLYMAKGRTLTKKKHLARRAVFTAHTSDKGKQSKHGDASGGWNRAIVDARHGQTLKPSSSLLAYRAEFGSSLICQTVLMNARAYRFRLSEALDRVHL